MRQFFKFFFASMLGFVVGMILLFFILIFIIAGAVSSLQGPKSATVMENTILKITLDKPITERTPNNPFANLASGEIKNENQPGLYDIVMSINKATSDKNIKGIYLNVMNVDGGMASVKEIRDALINFKKSKKFVIAYSELYSTKGYYLCSVADSVFLHPEGGMDFRGLASQLMFIKGTLEKLGVEPQIIRHGKFKSAVEPFTEEKMSDANREQMKALIDDLWKQALTDIGKSRGKTFDALELLADSLTIENPKLALQNGLVDGLKYEDEILAMLSRKCNVSDDKLQFASLEKYSRVPDKEKKFFKEKVAVVFATGDIIDGEGDDETIGSETTAAAIRKARTDKDVKAIVLRVNSPGGSALASDVIWREVTLARKAKPVVVSMGDLAASGGYYISCNADKIFAHPNTITGSIGVFGVLFNAQKLFNEKLGITFDTYKTGDYGDMGLPTRALTGAERNKIQNAVENIYDVFTRKVSEGRNIAQSQVDSLGQGRVWSGEDGKQLHLVDAYGGLTDAIAEAARMAKITDYRISQLPIQKDPIQELLQGSTESTKERIIKNELGSNAMYFTSLRQALHMKGVQVRLPYTIVIE